MAGGISDETFKEEMLRLMKFAVIKIGENSKEITEGWPGRSPGGAILRTLLLARLPLPFAFFAELSSELGHFVDLLRRAGFC